MQFLRKHRLRKDAKTMMHEVRNVLNMNRDLLAADAVASLEANIDDLIRLRKNGTEQELESAVDTAQTLAREATTPCRSPAMRELTETLVVAFGVAMAFRAYFFQPFKIPTGSMQPTLYGIHSVTVKTPEDGPGLMDRMPMKPFKWLLTGVWYRDVTAKADGSVSVFADNKAAPGYVILSVAGEKFKVPDDAARRGDLLIPNQKPIGMADAPNSSRHTIASGYVTKGQRLWAGYITSGDQVFVNRMAWNFFPPKRGDVIVFATSRAELAFTQDEVSKKRLPDSVVTKVPKLPVFLIDTPIPGLAAAQHYIKRLVGLPGEKISVTHPHVYADGVKVEGLFGMDRVAAMQESETGGAKYTGYHCTMDEGMPSVASSFLSTPADSIFLDDKFLPMGDNTLNSWDGRYWGGVPRTQMLGPGSCVYWPLSRRWGRIR